MDGGIGAPTLAYRFVDFVFDPSRAAFTEPDGREVPLRPKGWEVLRLLLDRAGRVVTREEILDAVWPGVFVTDDSVTQCVAEVRRALGERAGLLRTVPRRGYVLDAEVTREATEVGRMPVMVADEEGPAASERRSGRATVALRRVAVAGVVVLLGFAGWWLAGYPAAAGGGVAQACRGVAEGFMVERAAGPPVSMAGP